MSLQFGYLLPTREHVMRGRPEAAPLLSLAERAEDLGYDSVWVGDSLLARPRHEPLTLLAGVAGRTNRVALGTAVLLPALRNPVLLTHQVATLDQVSEGRIILGVGIAADVPNVRAEFGSAGVPFEHRGGRMLEGLRLCRAFWTGRPVEWAGRWHVEGATLGPTPHRSGGPPIWIGGAGPLALARAGGEFDGWFPTGPDAAGVGERWARVQAAAREAGRDPRDVTCAVYLTVAIDDDADRAEAAIDGYLNEYYGQPPALLRQSQACVGGSFDRIVEWIAGYVAIGASHIVLRFVGDHERHLESLVGTKDRLA